MNKTGRILVVDDEESVRESLALWLEDIGHIVYKAEDAYKALKILHDTDCDVMLVDMKMPGMDGVDLIKRARELIPGLPCIVITAYASIPSAIEAMKEGAFDYLQKPFCPERIEILIDNILIQKSLEEENILLRKELEKKFRLDDIVGKSDKMQKVFDLVRTVAKSSASVLIHGESGTGKELIARAIHQHSDRADKPFVATSCAAIPETLIESELFGHEKGSFTGAIARKIGRFEEAHGGTLFLDEVSEIPMPQQVLLLRVLQEKELRRVGGNELIKIDVRIISATNKDLQKLIAEGKFREDLFYRLNVVNVNIPPLRERKEDITPLANYFLRKFNAENRKSLRGFTDDAKAALLKKDWPGNVRQLENAIEHAVIIARGDLVDMGDLPGDLIDAESLGEKKKDKMLTLEELEKEHILEVLELAGGNRTKAASLLGISRVCLYDKLKKYGIDG
ncbi:MAG: sigma-54 dependent transcriptional regulator [Chloroflexi bacterium]|nr:sigma-54 dependent transcriptional regulator [Chloroflexota bacterium]